MCILHLLTWGDSIKSSCTKTLLARMRIPASPQAPDCNYHPVELDLDSSIASDEHHGCNQIILICIQGHSMKVADS